MGMPAGIRYRRNSTRSRSTAHRSAFRSASVGCSTMMVSTRVWQTTTPSFSSSCYIAIMLSLSCCYNLLQCSSSCKLSLPLLPTTHAFTATPLRSRNEAPPINFVVAYTNTIHGSNNIKNSNSRLYSLKPAAVPLMDCGKALARSGELLIDLTTSLDIYGGSLSAMGANVRNCGDCLAQAAASCRFKTGVELVTDELREGTVI